MSKRIYTVVVADKTETRHLVKASSAAQAIRFVAQPMFSAKVTSQDELVELIGSGIKVKET